MWTYFRFLYSEKFFQQTGHDAFHFIPFQPYNEILLLEKKTKGRKLCGFCDMSCERKDTIVLTLKVLDKNKLLTLNNDESKSFLKG